MIIVHNIDLYLFPRSLYKEIAYPLYAGSSSKAERVKQEATILSGAVALARFAIAHCNV